MGEGATRSYAWPNASLPEAVRENISALRGYVHEPYDRTAQVQGLNRMETRISLLLTFCLLSNIGLCAAAEPPEVVIVRRLPEAAIGTPPAAVVPAPGRPLGWVTAPQNVTSQTLATIERSSTQSSPLTPPFPQLFGPASENLEILLTGFDGGTGQLAPADIGGAVGPRDVVSTLNGAYYFYTKEGNLEKSVSGPDFWCTESLPGCPNTDVDPRIVYDFASRRWITSALVGGGNAAVTTWLAVSQTSDPTGAWYLYSFPSCGSAYSTDLGDQPKLGINRKWIVIKDASCHGISPNEKTLHVFDKDQLYHGATLQVGINQFEFADQYDLDIPVVTFAPSTIKDREYLAVSNVLSNGDTQVIFSYLEGTVDAPVLHQPIETVSLTVTGSGSVPEGFQLGCLSPCIGSEDDARINSASVSVGKNEHDYILITFALGTPVTNPNGSTVVLVATDTTSGAAASRAIVSTSPDVVGYPSVVLANHSNTAIVGYASFTTTNYPAAKVNEWDIRTNVLSTSKTFAQSTVEYTFGTRWGDFSTTVPDPSNSRVIWSAQDYDPLNFFSQDSWWQEIRVLRSHDDDDGDDD
jgi:hypothetical protein